MTVLYSNISYEIKAMICTVVYISIYVICKSEVDKWEAGYTGDRILIYIFQIIQDIETDGKEETQLFQYRM